MKTRVTIIFLFLLMPIASIVAQDKSKDFLGAMVDELADTNGDGYITALELGSFLSEKVTLDSDNQQTPQLRNLTSDEGQFIFFRDEFCCSTFSTC